MSRTLSMTFDCDSGDTRTISISEAAETLTEDIVVAAGSAIVEAAIFEDPVTALTKAVVVDRESTTLYEAE